MPPRADLVFRDPANREEDRMTDPDGGPLPRGQAPPRAGPAAPTPDLGPTLADLERAARSFNRRFGGALPPDAPGPAPEPSFGERMRQAEREAAAYLEDAKRRADSLVNTMVAAVEREAAEMRREAEAGIRARWEAVELDATRHLEEARRVAERLVAERQRRIAALSEGITARAQALTAGLEDAERVRSQFESFVRALSRAADQVAAEGRASTEHAVVEPSPDEQAESIAA
jgi:hypothetical protein